MVLSVLALVVGVVVGAAAVVLGEGDDSPGLQGLGGLIVVGTVLLVARRGRRRRRS